MILLVPICLLMLIFPRSHSQNVIRRYYHSSTVAGHWIYVDGGEVVILNPEGSNYPLPVNYTLAINLSEDWTNRTLEPVSTQRTSGQPLPVYFGSLWWDDQHRTIYQFGGERPFGLPLSVDSSDESIWGFNPDEKGGGNWNQYIGIRANAPWTQGLVHPTHGFSGSTDRSGYFFGGIATGDSDNHFKVGDEVALPGFVTFDFNTYTLENSTNAPDTFQNLRTYIASGKIVSVPYPGTQGLLLIFPNPAQLGFNNITIFDIAGQRWLWQTAAGVEDGDVPSVRTAFCVVWVQGNSQDTSEIYLYGGYDGTTGTGVPSSDAMPDSDFYILSLPAFRWFRAGSPSPDLRSHHTCHAAGNNQMIIIGGWDRSQYDNGTHSPPDPWDQQINVFDMSALHWRNSYNSSADQYTPPAIVREYYDQASSRYPSSWSSTEVQRIFEANNSTLPGSSTFQPSSYNATSLTLTSASTSLSSSHKPTISTLLSESTYPASSLGPTSSTLPVLSVNPNSLHLSVGAIVGITIGGFSLLAIWSGCLIRFRGRRQIKNGLSGNGTAELIRVEHCSQLQPQVEHFNIELPTSPPELQGSRGGIELYGQCTNQVYEI